MEFIAGNSLASFPYFYVVVNSVPIRGSFGLAVTFSVGISLLFVIKKLLLYNDAST